MYESLFRFIILYLVQFDGIPTYYTLGGESGKELFLNTAVIHEDLRKAELATIITTYANLSPHDKGFLTSILYDREITFIDQNYDWLDYTFHKCKELSYKYVAHIMWVIFFKTQNFCNAPLLGYIVLKISGFCM